MVNSAIFTMVFVCIIAIIVVAINSQKTNIELASKQMVQNDKTETMQREEEQGIPKAITEIKARTPNTDNFTYVTSLDGFQVPVPKGYVASPAETERYRDGKYETWKKQEDLTFKPATTYYLDQTLTLASPEGETNPWTENATVGAWQSENYQVASSTSTIETNEFTVANNGNVVRIVWSVSSQNVANTDYAYYTITNTATSTTIGGTSMAIYGTGNGTAEASLIFNNTDVVLDAGTYKVAVAYTKNADTDTDLDRAYVKSINVYSTSANPSNPSIEVGSANDYAWIYDSNIEAWKSENYNISNSTSTIESNSFTVTEAAKVRITWSVCSQATNDYVYYTITNIDTGATVGGTSTKISGTGNGTAEDSLRYLIADVNLEEGTYKVEVKYVKNYTTNTNLDRSYLKSVKVYTQSAISEDSFNKRVGSGGFVIYEKNAGETEEEAREEIIEDIDTAQEERNQFVWVPVPNIEAKELKTALTKSDNDQNYLKQYLEGINKNEFLQEMKVEYINMLESVASYGGFYIGRYETGNMSSKVPVVRRKNTKIANETWYTMYKRCKNLKRGNKSIETGMMWWIQYDKMLEWLVSSGEFTSKNQSVWGKGNYRNKSFSYTNQNGQEDTKRSGTSLRMATGSSEDFCINGIYDLAGNVAEWLMDVDYGNFQSEGILVRTTVGEHYGCNLTSRDWTS